MTFQLQSRNRLTYAFLIALTIAIGLASRKFADLLPWWLAKNVGDVLYATMAFWIVGVLFPNFSALRTATVAAAFCVMIEFAKLIQVPWLVALRHSKAGALVLGSGFHPSNLVCYFVVVILGVGLELLLKQRQA